MSAPATGRQFVLVHAGQRAVVTEVGATLRSWCVDGRERLDTFPAAEHGHGYRGKVLLPWPNRIAGGRYDFRGAQLQAAVTEPARGAALHGLVAWVNWRIARRREAAVALEYRLLPQPGYPFTLDLRVEYALGDGGLEVTLGAVNVGAGPAPFGAGIHPYLATGRVAQARLRLPARTRLHVDERLIPDGGRSPVAGSDWDFRVERPVGDAVLDTCFTDLERDADGLARARLVPAGGDAGATTLWMDGAFGHLQAYTADADPEAHRRRRSIALEPMTCAPDAFNSGEGLLVLEPGQAFHGRCGLAPE